MISDEQYEELLKNYRYNFKCGDLIKGKVESYIKEGAIIEIGAKASAICPEKEMAEHLEENMEYEFLIIKEEDEDGIITLSHKRVQNIYNWKQLEEAKKQDKIIEGTITKIVKGGFVVDVLGIRGFVPASQIKEAEAEIGKNIQLKILLVEPIQNNFILSNKKVYSDTALEMRKDLFSQLEIGQVVKGEVVRITEFGAFVDIGGVDGLLPLSQISWKWVEHPSDVLKIGEKIDVEIIGVDFDKQRVSLSLKNLEQDPWIEAKGKLQEGAIVKGTITRIKHFGAFVEVYPSVEALLPQSEVLQYQNEHGSILYVGEIIDTVILKFNPDDKRIALGVNFDKN